MSKPATVATWIAALLWAAGCGDHAAGPADGGDAAMGSSCNPLGSDDCLTPFPSTAFLEQAATATGWRVSLVPEVLPVNTEDVPIDPAFWNRLDGFSSATYVLAYFPEGVDAGDLPPLGDPAQSLEATSPTVIVEVPSGERVPHFAEIDANAKKDEDYRQGLILRPVVRLKAGSRYAVGLKRSLGPAIPPGFQAILDGTPSGNPTLERLRPDYDAIFNALGKAGLAREDLLLAWDFYTASDGTFVEPMQAMVGEALDAVPTITYVVDGVNDYASGDTLRVVTGTFEVPNFLGADGYISDPPEPDGVFTAEFTVLIPRAAENGPLPVLLFGHGIFGSG
ncbi:MAG: hypothetical protein ACRDH5_04725, partial [bacterium]